MKNVMIIMSLWLGVTLRAQTTDTTYERAYVKLHTMLKGEEPISFKRAVLTVENAYFEGGLDTAVVQEWITRLKNRALFFKQTKGDDFLYSGNDRDKILIHASAFKVMMDTLGIIMPTDTLYRYPFRYDFEDASGHFDWTKMFVSKLLNTGTGNCHSLPYLYKILIEELGEETHLAMAPNHVYIKHRCEELGMYNTELTSGSFPIDAWLMASGYIHLDAIRNRLYLEALNDTQSIALCMVDLAQGYRHKYSMGDGSFVLRCCETALEYYPHCINALLLKTDGLRAQWENIAYQKTTAVTKAEEAEYNYQLEMAFADLEQLAGTIHELGYRRMPEEMYIDWLVSLRKEREKYENPKIKSTFNNQ